MFFSNPIKACAIMPILGLSVTGFKVRFSVRAGMARVDKSRASRGFSY